MSSTQAEPSKQDGSCGQQGSPAFPQQPVPKKQALPHCVTSVWTRQPSTTVQVAILPPPVQTWAPSDH